MSRELVRPTDSELDSMNLEQLHSLIVSVLSSLARDYVLLGKLLIRVERQGGRVREIASNVHSLLRKLATGIIVEEAARHLTSKPSLLRYLSELPPDEQRSLLCGEMQVEIVLDLNPLKTSGMINLLDVDSESYRQLFARGRQRSKAEQILWLEQQAKRRPPVTTPALPLYEGRERGLAINIAPNKSFLIPWPRVESLIKQQKAKRVVR